MFVSLIVIILILVFGYIYSTGFERNSNRNRRNYIKLISFLLILQSGLRNVAVGSDTYQYLQRFLTTKNSSWLQLFQDFFLYYKLGIGKDPGYSILEKIFQIFITNYQLWLLFIAILFFYALGRFIYYNTSKISHAVVAYVTYSVLFFSFFSITGHRQTIATAIILLCFELIKKRNFFLFLFWVLIASTIHKSVMIFIPFYFIGTFKKFKLINIISLLIFPVGILLRNELFGILKIFGLYENFEIYEGAGTFTFTLMYLLISVVALIRLKYISSLSINSKYYYNALSLGLLLLPLTWVNPSAMRVVQFFSIFILILIPFIIESFKVYSVKIKSAARLFFIFLMIIVFVRANIDFEYKFFWQEMSLGDNYN
jgi:hypothetical protein